ncbi:uncharacterized protein LOC119431561 isoform X2 [Dermacentor silvarum]|uniref:uncharacterized protein LOC119431561 isoform X2 n=1 Tax=Dermacentor silvarum TaxID=543639 RepID=UPI002100C3D4|nr:uncharacterized protein LOC119431561 isoform X2 [Dermacentor silvarum]
MYTVQKVEDCRQWHSTTWQSSTCNRTIQELQNNIPRLSWNSKNNKTLAQLYRSMMTYFARFDFHRKAMSITAYRTMRDSLDGDETSSMQYGMVVIRIRVLACGSFVSGLGTTDSDLDLTVLREKNHDTDEEVLSRVEGLLKLKGSARVDTVKLVPARVPVVTFVHQSGLAVDLTVGKSSSVLGSHRACSHAFQPTSSGWRRICRTCNGRVKTQGRWPSSTGSWSVT